MAEQYANDAQTTLANAAGSGDTSITVSSVTGFPGSASFRVRIDGELLLVTGIAGTTWTVTRAVEAVGGVQTAAAHGAGATVTHVLTAASVALTGGAPGGSAGGDLTGTYPNPTIANTATPSVAGLTVNGKADIQSHYGPLHTDTDAATITFDLTVSNLHTVQLGGNRTLALANPSVGQPFLVILQQDGVGSRTVTWWSGILWPGGSAPTLTTTLNKRDVFSFVCIASGVYLGFVAGQNL